MESRKLALVLSRARNCRPFFCTTPTPWIYAGLVAPYGIAYIFDASYFLELCTRFLTLVLLWQSAKLDGYLCLALLSGNLCVVLLELWRPASLQGRLCLALLPWNLCLVFLELLRSAKLQGHLRLILLPGNLCLVLLELLQQSVAASLLSCAFSLPEVRWSPYDSVCFPS